ncbi:TetR/AcrR family transcriptional regulator [Nocardia transvalensis]|uniref:TetR/AcrR family transcriptional regulator n=1 Tax=Nocardia transvalensis TaxID=37333 RepID=UPI001893B24D|nr:TetR/AcrR family transcriptional regulator [Nocardia transvalensis]MBF6329953.1 TetR/AcrR family transcriptional regulator [Nocardia transvalensis]
MSQPPTWSPAAERILRTAAELFAVRGYSGTSTRDIAFRVGVQQPAIYKHFSAKDDILVALIRSAVDRPLALAERLDAVSAPAVVKLHCWLLDTLRHLHDSPYLLASIFSAPELQQDRFAAERDLLERLEQVVVSLVAAGQREGDIRPIDTVSAARLVLALFDALALPGIAVSPPEITEFALAGLLADPARLPEIARSADELAVPSNVPAGRVGNAGETG